MFLLDTLPRMLVCLFLFTAMLSVGLQTTTGDLRALLGSKGYYLRALLANFAAVPIIGIVLARTLPLEPAAATAFLILACTPGGISALQFTTKIKGAAIYAGGSAFLLSFLAVFLAPALLSLLRPGGLSRAIPFGLVALFLVLFQLVPLVAGVLVRHRQERLAGKLAKLCAILSAVAYTAFSVLILAWRKQVMQAVDTPTLLGMLLLVLAAMTVGWFAGGPEKQTRGLLATVTGMRHVGLGLLIALYAFPDPTVRTFLVAFSALMIPPNLVLTAVLVIGSKRAARAAAGQPGPPEKLA